MEREALLQELATAGSVSALARSWGVHQTTARYRLHRAGIVPPRTGFKSPGAGSRKRGAEHYNWKGGTYIKGSYVMEYAPDHPAATKGYVPQHRLVMEKALGRLLQPHELVHHKGTRFPLKSEANKQDNRPENLELIARVPHIQLHKASAPRDGRGRFKK